MPFVLLTLPDSLQAWAAVYYYAIIGTIVSLVSFNPPAKATLRKKLAQRAKMAGVATPGATTPAVEKTSAEVQPLVPGQSREGTRGPHLGLPDDPGAELDDIMDEIKREVEYRRSRGQSISQGLQEAMNEKITELRQKGGGQSREVANQLDNVLDGFKADGVKKSI